MANLAYDDMQPNRHRSGYRWIGESLSSYLFSELAGAAPTSPGLRLTQDGSLDVGRSLPRTYNNVMEAIGLTGRQVVMPGYYGSVKYISTTVALPRGGSDISSVVATAAMKNGGLLNWSNQMYTDVDGVCVQDPADNPDCRVHEWLSYADVREIVDQSPDRNGVVHGQAIDIAEKYSVPLQVRNAFNLEVPGTTIGKEK